MLLIQMHDDQDNFKTVGNDHYQVVNKPFDIFDEEKSLNMDYRSWVVQFDLDHGWICSTDFGTPLGHEFANSTSSVDLTSVYNPDEDSFYLMFAPSDSLYQIKNCVVERRFKLSSVKPFTYLPGFYEKNGRNRSWRNNPKSASNISLTYDPVNKLYLRVVLVDVEETQPEETDILLRQGLNRNTYLMLIYDQEWNLKAEVELFYDVGQSFGEIIAAKEGLFITKPEQKSEDEYEFYKIDLSRFADK
ncbi:DUF4221 family protein [Algoriphagus sp. Y33]|uniref:DUF4221 family protein n=1 Tax=Algoriphagus sp. Y33 TaxID=2772483 RepID=UPI00177B347C|nr:DUF4221 family protein [Algoriphagus sp. Y33]